MPPTIGPRPAPPAKEAIITPSAAVRCFSSVNSTDTSAIADGASVAPASPCTARAAISISALVDRAASTEAAPNAAAPASSTLRRPIRSPSVPIVIRAPAMRKP